MTDYASIQAAVLFVLAENVLVRRALCDFVEVTLPDWLVLDGGFDETTIALVRSRQPDVVLIDLAIPSTDGASLIRKLRTVVPSTPIIALTVDHDELYLDALRAAGSTCCLPIWELRHSFLSALEDGLSNDGRTRTQKKIVCVEDDLDTMELIRFILERHDFTMIGALGGLGAQAIIREQQPDLVLLDLMMPGVSGWDVYEQMQADTVTREIPVIVITVLDPGWIERESRPIGELQGYLIKPFNPRDLLTAIGRTLSQKVA